MYLDNAIYYFFRKQARGGNDLYRVNKGLRGDIKPDVAQSPKGGNVVRHAPNLPTYGVRVEATKYNQTIPSEGINSYALTIMGNAGVQPRTRSDE